MLTRLLSIMIAMVFALITLTGYTAAGTYAIDTTDPEQVAVAFIKAVAKKDINSAILFVAPKERASFRKELSLPLMPPWPSEPKIKLMIESTKGQVIIENFEKPAGMDMKLIQNRWWVVK